MQNVRLANRHVLYVASMVCLFAKVLLTLKYRRSALGILWSLVSPLTLTLTTTVVFSSIFHLRFQDHILSVSIGMICWIYFNQVIFNSSSIYIQFENLIKKLSFPLYVLPLAVVLSSALDLLLYMVGALIISLGHLKAPGLLFSLLILFSLTIFATGTALYVSVVNVFYRDFQWIISVVMQALFFLTPIAYKVKDIDDGLLRVIVMVNPLADFVNSFTDSVLYGAYNMKSLLYLLAIGAANLLVGIYIYARNKYSIVVYL